MPLIDFPPSQGLKSGGNLVASTIQFLTSGKLNGLKGPLQKNSRWAGPIYSGLLDAIYGVG
jgi:hypothetical protein